MANQSQNQNQDSNPGGHLGGWAGLAGRIAGMPAERMAPLAWLAVTIGAFWFLFWQAPNLIEARDANSWRLIQEESERNRQANGQEWERNRQFTAERDRQILEVFRAEGEKSRASIDSSLKFLFQSIVALSKQMAALEAAVDMLRKRLEAGASGTGRELMPMPAVAVSPAAGEAAQWLRLVMGVRWLLRDHDGADDRPCSPGPASPR